MVTKNTSASGGPLLPVTPGPAPDEGQDLLRFLQQWMLGIIEFDGQLVRPRWQAEPPNIPNAGDAWVAFGIQSRTAQTFPAIIHDPSGDGSDYLNRDEVLDILASFYDTGSSGKADYYASLFRDGIAIPQNLEPLTAKKMGFRDHGDLVSVPLVVKTRWLYRVDFGFKISRMITRQYPVRNLLSAQMYLVCQDFIGNNLTLSVTTPPL